MRFAIIGCGVISRFHASALAALRSRAQLVLAVDRREDHAAAFAAEFGISHTTSTTEALERPDIDAIVICAPSGLHADLTVAALRAGKHVVVEKPLAIDLAGARAIAEAERAAGRTVAAISQMRFLPATALVQQLAGEGRFGRVTSGTATVPWWRAQSYYDTGGWHGTRALEGGGALITQGIHLLDLLLWTMAPAGDPVEVFAYGGALAHEGIEVEDTLTATIRFSQGALATVHATTAARPGLAMRLSVHGDQGSAELVDGRLARLHLDGAEPDRSAEFSGGFPPTAELPGLDAATVSLVDQYLDFLRAVANGTAPLVDTTQATRTLATVLAIYDSVGSGAAVPVESVLADQRV